MNKPLMLYKLAREAIKTKWAKFRSRKKVAHLGLWVEGGLDDHGDCYVAFIHVNGQENAVAVRSVSSATALSRRNLIIKTMMTASRKDAQERLDVQLIARTDGDKTVEYD